MPQLFLRLLTPALETDDGFDMAAQWLLRDDAGMTVEEGTTDGRGLAEIVDTQSPWAQDPRNIIVLVPVDNVALLSCTVPGRSVSQIRRALPFAVEEFLTQDVETMHLAHGPIAKSEPISCVLVDKGLLSNWLTCLNEAGLTPGVMVPDASLLPAGGQTASVLFEFDGALVHTPEHIANIDLPLLPDVLSAVYEHFDNDGSANGTPALHLVNGRMPEVDTSRSGFPNHQIHETLLDGSVLEYLASRWADSGVEINMLQGAYAPTKKAHPAWGRWKSVGGLVALWAVTYVGVLLAEGLWSDYRADSLRAESLALYRQIYPSERRVPNAYTQMRRHLGQIESAGAGFHTLVGQLANGIDKVVKGTELRSLSFSDSRGELTTELWVPNYDELDKLKAQLEGQGLAVVISSAEEQDSQVRARFRVRAGG